MRTRIILSVPILLFQIGVLMSQPMVERVRHLYYKDGLSDRTVRHVAKDTKGFLWIATQNGLNRYTGQRFDIYSAGAEPPFQIKENQLRKVVEIGQKKLVILNTRREINFEVFDLETAESRLVETLGAANVEGSPKAVHAAHLDRVYLLTEHWNGYHLYFLNLDFQFEKLASISIPHKKQVGEIRFVKGKNGHFWIQDSANGLMCFTPYTNRVSHIPMVEINGLTSQSETPYSTSVLHEDGKGDLWVAFPYRNGLLRVTNGQQQPELVDELPPDELYSGIWEDLKGNLFIGTFQSYGLLNNLYFWGSDGYMEDAQWVLDIDNKVNCMFGDDFTDFFILGTHVGLYKVKMANRPIKWILADQQLSESQWSDGISIRGITDDGEGNIYIGRELKAWYRFNNANFELENLQVNDANGWPVRLWCNSNVVYDKRGFLWGGSCAEDRGGLLHKFDLRTGVATTYPIANREIRHILLMENGELLLASGTEDGDGLLSFFDPNSEVFSHFKNREGVNPLAGRMPNYIHIGKDSLIWVATDEGLFRVDSKAQSSALFTNTNSRLINDNILVIHEAEDGRLWLGTHGGINILDLQTGQVEQLNSSDGLSNNIVCGILPDGDGNYFISTFHGLSYYDTRTGFFSNFFQSKGLTFNEFNRLAFHKDNKGNFYFGTLNGVNMFKKEDLLRVDDGGARLQWLSMARVSNDGDREQWSTQLTNRKTMVMHQRDDHLELDFFLSYHPLADENRYAAKLEGYDTKWRLLGNTPHLVIDRPPPGKYLLRIKAAPARGDWKEEELQLGLIVKQAFYQKPWFLVALPGVVILLSYLASRWYVLRIKKQEEHQTSINKKFAELELQALRSQMNPHFVFNALGSIQYHIQKNKIEEADNYLAKFAKLMRLFLESSKNKYIPLSEEINLLTLYVGLEKMRFEGKFDYEITVGEEIDMNFREIPSILIQPFVENAINHGLFNKEGKGHLVIHFSEDEEGTLTCTIKDDGVGRKKAGEMKAQTRKTHKSRGMQIVYERLEVLQFMDDLKIKVTIEDLYPDKQDTGTIVRIEIPDVE